MSNVTLFSQIIHKIDRTLFNKLVVEKQTDKGCKGFNSWTHLVSMLFCHFAKSTSVQDIKQLLHIKTFIGTSKNAVMIQIWTALITILMLKAMKNQAKYGWHLSNLVAFIRLNIFVKIELQRWLNQPFEDPPTKTLDPKQGDLFSE